MKVQPQKIVNVFSLQDACESRLGQQCSLQYCQHEELLVEEQPESHSCLPWIAKKEQHAAQGSGATAGAGFALTSAHGVLQQRCCVGLQHAEARAFTSAAWHSSSEGADTWLSPAGTCSATAAHGCSLIVTDIETGAQLEVAGPGARVLDCKGWQQVFVHDAGVALLAIQQQDQLVMNLWQQPSSNSSSSSRDQQGCKSWQLLPALPVLPGTGADTQHNAAAGSTAAVFAQQGLSGLQLCVAHVVPVNTGVVLLSMLQQTVFGPSPDAEQQWLQGSGAKSSWRSMLLILPGADVTSTPHMADQLCPDGRSVASKLQLTAAATAAAVPAPGAASPTKPCSDTVSVLLASWHPAGSRLAVAVSTACGAAWVVLFTRGVQEVQECCWSNYVDKRGTGLLHCGACRISSMAWLSAGPGALAVIDSHGRLCLLSGGALERLQLVDMAGMTITFKPVVQLHYSTLLAATSSQVSIAALNQHFLLAPMPPAAPSSSKLKGGSQQLAIYNGKQLLVCALYPGIDPSQRRIDQSLNARALLLYGRNSTSKLDLQKQQQQLEAEERGRTLAVRLPEACGAAIGSAAVLIPGQAVLGMKCAAGIERASTPAGVLNSVTLVVNPMLARSSGSSAAHPSGPQGQVPHAVAYGTDPLCQQQQQQHTELETEQAGVQADDEPQDRFWQLLAAGDADFLAGRWQDSEEAYKEALPLTAGHMVSLLLCQYKLREALGFIQQLLVDVLEAQNAWRSDCTAAAAHEDKQQQQQQHDVLQVAVRLAATLTGLTTDVLLAAVRGVGDQASAGPKLPCIFPTPLHWTKWIKHGVAQQEVAAPCKWELTSGMAVELLPSSILAALLQQLSMTPLHDSSGPVSLYVARAAAARAAGLLLMSEVLAAEATGSALPDDLPELLADAMANTALPAGSTGDHSSSRGQAQCGFLWQHAAVLAVSCSRVIKELQMQEYLAHTFDRAARSVLWRHLMAHHSEPLPVLAQRAVAVTVVAASQWPADHPCLQQLTNKVLGLLCSCLGLRILSQPVLPAPTAAASAADPQPDLQAMLLQLLLFQALPAAIAAAKPDLDQLLGAPPASQEWDACSAQGKQAMHGVYSAAAECVLGHGSVKQLVQLLAWLQLKADPTDAALDLAHLGSRLAAAGAGANPEAWAPHVEQALIAAGLVDKDRAQQQQQQQQWPLNIQALAELSCQCDVHVLSSAVLLVAQAASGYSIKAMLAAVGECWAELAAKSSDPGSSRVQLSGQQGSQAWWQQEVPESSVQEAMQVVANVAWLMTCRQQVANAASASPPGPATVSLVTCLAAADGVHKQQLLQQTMLSVLSRPGCTVTQQDAQQLQTVLDSCCGGTLPRTADQLHKLLLSSDNGQDQQQQQQYWEPRHQFLQQLQAAATAAARQESSQQGSCQSHLPAALVAVQQHGAACLQSFRQAIPGLQACLVHPLADAPEPSATTAHLALAAVLLGSNSLSEQQPDPRNSAAEAEDCTGLAADAVTVEVPADAQAAAAASGAAAGAAASLHAAAAAWQHQHVSVLQDKHLMQDVRAVLGSTSRWSLGSFLGAGSRTFRSGRLSIRSIRSLNAPDFDDFLMPSSSFTVPSELQGSAAGGTGAAGAAGTSVSSSQKRDSYFSASGAHSSNNDAATAAAWSKAEGSRMPGLAAQQSGTQWNNPLAMPAELSSLDSFYAVFSPMGSFCDGSRAASPSSQSGRGAAAASRAGQQPGGAPSGSMQQQYRRLYPLPTSPGSLQSQGLSPHSQKMSPAYVARIDSLGVRSSAPGSLSSSMLASPRSPLGASAGGGTGLSLSGTSFSRQFSPLQHHRSQKQRQQLLQHQSSSMSRARSLSRSQSSEVWEQLQRRSSFGGALDAIQPKALAQQPSALSEAPPFTWESTDGSHPALWSQQSTGTTDLGCADAGRAQLINSDGGGEAGAAAQGLWLSFSGGTDGCVGVVLGNPTPCTPIHEHEALEGSPATGVNGLDQPASAIAAAAALGGTGSTAGEGSSSSSSCQARDLPHLLQQQQQHSEQEIRQPGLTAGQAGRPASQPGMHRPARLRVPVDRQQRSSPGSSAAATPYNYTPGSKGASSSPSSKLHSSSLSPGGTAASTGGHARSPMASSRTAVGSWSPMGSSRPRSHAHGTSAGKPGVLAHLKRPEQQQPGNVVQQKQRTPAAAVAAAGKQHGSGGAQRAVAKEGSKAAGARGKPLGEAAEQQPGITQLHGSCCYQQQAAAAAGTAAAELHLSASAASAVSLCSSSKQRNAKQRLPGASRQWLLKLQRACRWPRTSTASCKPEAPAPHAGLWGQHSRPRALAEGRESAAVMEDTGSSCSQISSNRAAAAAADFQAAAAGVAASWSQPGCVPGSNCSSPHLLNAAQQQHLDELLKAHLPEFINILSQGMSPVKEPSFKGGLGCSPQQAANRDPASPSLQRSFSMVQLSGAAGPPEGLMMLRASAEHAASELWTQAPGLSEPCTTSSCNNATIDQHSTAVQQQWQKQQEQPEVTSAAAAGGQHAPRQPGAAAATLQQVSSIAMVHIAAEGPSKQDSHSASLLLPVQCRPLEAGALATHLPAHVRQAAVPVAEGAEEGDTPDTPGSVGSSCYAANRQQQQHVQAVQRTRERSSSGIRHSASFDNIPQMMQLVRMMMSSAAADGTAGSDAVASKHLAGQQHSLANTAGATGQGVAAAEDVNELDIAEFMGCYSQLSSPVAASRQLSRTASTNAAEAAGSMRRGSTSQRLLAAAAAAGGMMAALSDARTSSRAGSVQDSPRATTSVPDMDAFWADSGTYSSQTSRAPSRQLSNAQHIPDPAYHLAHQQQQQPEGGISTVAGAFEAPAQFAAAAVRPQAAAAGSSTSGVMGGVAGHVLHTPSPSKKAMLLHGPSRLSWKSPGPAGDAAAAAAAAAAPTTAAAAAAAIPEGGESDGDGIDEASSQLQPLIQVEEGQQPQQQQPQQQQQQPQGFPHQQQQQEQNPPLQAQQQQHPFAVAYSSAVELLQQEQDVRKPLLKRMLFGKLGRSSSEGTSHQRQQLHLLQQELLQQEFAPLKRASHQLQQPTLDQEEQLLPSPDPKKKPQRLFGFLQRSRSRSPVRQAKRQDKDTAAAGGAAGAVQSSAGDAGLRGYAASCPSTPTVASAAVVSCASSQMQQQPAAGFSSQQTSSCPAAPVAAADLAAAAVQDGSLLQPAAGHVAAAALGAVAPPSSAAAGAAGNLSLGPSLAAAHAPDSPAMDVLASSMQRIAGFLEEFLGERSPAHRDTAAAASPDGQLQRRPSHLSPAAAAHVVEQGVASSSEAMAAASTVTQQQHLAAGASSWSPAAAAAKRRIMGSTGSPNWVRQAAMVAAAVEVAAGQDSSGPVQQPEQQQQEAAVAVQANKTDIPAVELHSQAGGGWLHPGSCQPMAAAVAIAAAQSQQEQVIPAPPPEGIQQPQQLAQQLQGSIVTRAPAEDGVKEGPSAEEGPKQLAGLLALASRAAGVHLRDSLGGADFQHTELHRGRQTACAAADSGAAEEGETASLLHVHGSPLKAQKQRQQERQGRRSPGKGQQQQLWRPGSRAPAAPAGATYAAVDEAAAAAAGTAVGSMWRRNPHHQPPHPGDGDSSSGDEWHQGSPQLMQQHQQQVRHQHQQQQQQQVNEEDQFSFPVHVGAGLQAAALQQGPPPGAGHVAAPGMRRPLGCTGAEGASARCLVAAADVKLLQPERGTQLRLLRPSQLRGELSAGQQQHSAEIDIQQRQQEQQQHSAPPSTTYVYTCSPTHSTYRANVGDGDDCGGVGVTGSAGGSGPRLVRFPVAPEAKPLQPQVVLRTLQTGPQPEQEQRQQRLWSAGQQRQQQQPCAPWDPQDWGAAAGATVVGGGGAGPSEVSLTAGRRAAQLLQSLLQRKEPGSRGQDELQKGPDGQQAVALADLASKQSGGTAGTSIAAPERADSRQTAAGAAVVQRPSPVATHISTISPEQQQQQQWQLELHQRQQQQQQRRQKHLGSCSPAKSSAARSPKKASAVSRKWALLQQLKARNRTKRQAANPAGAAEASGMGAVTLLQQQEGACTADGSAAAQHLLAQLQALMQGPRCDDAGAGGQSLAVPAALQQPLETAGRRLDLDAAAASSLQGVLEQALQVRRQKQPQQRQQQGLGQQMLQQAGPEPLAESTSFGELGSQPLQAEAPLLNGPDVPQQQPLLLTRMLSRPPLVDAQVQAGSQAWQQQQQQQLLVGAGSCREAGGADAAAAALLADVQKLLQQQQQQAAPAEPVKVVLQVGDVSARDEATAPSAAAVQPHVQQQQAPLSPAALVALAAAAGAGAAAAVNASSPHLKTGVGAGIADRCTGAAAAGPHQKTESALELAQLILGAFEVSGGVITPDVGAGSAGGVLQQPDLLPNPLAGPAAPQFLQVLDFTPDAFKVNGQHTAAGVQRPLLQAQLQLVQRDGQAEQATAWQQQEQGHGDINLGCCFAACPDHMSSPELGRGRSSAAAFANRQGGSARAQCEQQGQASLHASREVRHVMPKAGGSASSSRPSSSSRKKQSSTSTVDRRHSAGKGRHDGVKKNHHHHHHHHHQHRFSDQQQAQQQQPQEVSAGADVGDVPEYVLSPTSGANRASCRLHEVRQSRQMEAQQQQQQPGGLPLSEWANQQTKQLAELWQQWQDQQGQLQRQQQDQQQQQGIENVNPNIQQQLVHTADAAYGKQLQQEKNGVGCQISQGGTSGPTMPYVAERYDDNRLSAAEAAASPMAAGLGVAPAALSGAAARAAAKKLAEQQQQMSQEQLAQQHLAEERTGLDAAYARACAARTAAKAAAERAASACSQRLRAELHDLGRMLAEVDSLAAQMEEEAAQAAAAVEQYTGGTTSVETVIGSGW